MDLSDLGAQQLYRIDSLAIPEPLDGRFWSRVSRAPIEAHWDDLSRVAGSLKRGYVTASLLVSKLQAYPRQNRLTRVLKEYGRLVKTVFVLRYYERNHTYYERNHTRGDCRLLVLNHADKPARASDVPQEQGQGGRARCALRIRPSTSHACAAGTENRRSICS